MLLTVVRHAESIENATRHTSFYQDPRPWDSRAAHALSRDLVGLTPRGYRQCQWLRTALDDLVGRDPYVYSSWYRRALDTKELALPGQVADVTALLNEQHYGDATYMTKRELFATWPECEEDRQVRKHLWKPPGKCGESLAVGVLGRATAFVEGLDEGAPVVVAITHHTAILALRSVLERRPVTELVDEARVRKTPNAGVLVYEQRGRRFHQVSAAEPDC
ncbi:histidine phosphatase family protein [Streptomyces sp. PTY087I2]|uniref:histidine phosphatase family protein n=1 Tax=Streptomyces sp. PTY087I2 TaxID=1819298 RepID=UPI00080B8BAF|nr:histidine phosphatase family protein [Streptomyces sp. PTY087I2]OCC09183.1 Histidine phosphatase superfamily (branch 1) [Streptomyces sp. PTY087I2]